MPSLPAAPASPWGKLFARTRAWLGVLMVASLALVTWQKLGMERVVELNAANANVFVHDDRGPGGASVATYTAQGGVARLQCDAVQQFAYPYCAMAFMLPAGGIDLSEFSHFSVDAAYAGPGPASLRLRIFNHEDGLTRRRRLDDLQDQ
jgi:hypothetical protein